MYFTGIKDEGDDNMSKLATVPLFFTLVLGDNPQVFEKTPRHAKKLFDEAILKKSRMIKNHRSDQNKKNSK
jgi:hypothetical protein